MKKNLILIVITWVTLLLTFSLMAKYKQFKNQENESNNFMFRGKG